MSVAVLARGRVRFEPTAPALDAAALRVRLEDVSRADARASLVAEATFTVSKPHGPGEPFPFVIRGEVSLDPRRHYSVRVHVDVNGSGTVSAGDFVSTQAHVVAAGRDPEELEILVRRVD